MAKCWRRVHAPRECRRQAGTGLLPQRVELPVLAEPRPVRNLDLRLHRLRHARDARRLWQLPEPVLERRTAPIARRAALWRVEWSGAERLRSVERYLDRPVTPDVRHP